MVCAFFLSITCFDKVLIWTFVFIEINQWLVGDCANVATRLPTPILQTLIDNCLEGEVELCLETLRLFEVSFFKLYTSY